MRGTIVVCPVFNERYTLVPFIDRLGRSSNADILFVDDGSKDGSTEILERSSMHLGDRVHVLCHPFRRGYGAALISGFKRALQEGFGRVITLDADLQHRPEDIVRFERILDHFEVALGTRYSDNSHISVVPRSRYLINRYISGMFERDFAVRFSDPFCGFRGYRASFLSNIELREQSYGVCLEMLMEIVQAGIDFCEIPVDLIYLDESRKFLDGLADPLKRLDYYRGVIKRGRDNLYRQRVPVQQ